MDDYIRRQAAIDALHMHLMYRMGTDSNKKRLDDWINGVPSAQPETNCSEFPNNSDTISRQAAIEAIHKEARLAGGSVVIQYADMFQEALLDLPSVQPERKWIPCNNPPKHHKDVIVRGIEAIGNVTVHKVMQWDVDTWRPTDYAPSVTWKEWSEI